MRQSMSRKNVEKIAKLTNLPVVKILVRGGTGHRKDLILDDGSVIPVYPEELKQLKEAEE